MTHSGAIFFYSPQYTLFEWKIFWEIPNLKMFSRTHTGAKNAYKTLCYM